MRRRLGEGISGINVGAEYRADRDETSTIESLMGGVYLVDSDFDAC